MLGERVAMQGTCIMRGGPRHLQHLASHVAMLVSKATGWTKCKGHAQWSTTVSPFQVLVRGRLHAVRGKGKSAFLVVRQGGAGATVQAVMFVDDKTVSKVRGHAACLAIPDYGQAPGSNSP